MIRTLTFATAVLFSSFLIAAPNPTMKEIERSGFHIRTCPSTACTSVAKTEQGQKVVVFGHENNEGIRWIETSAGWIASNAF